ncbi:MAG: polymer-forming cytoskeletal protein, partial [Rhodothermales bacterium]|nr:polymer-forming cytoskeletal protein [Rhodothermales bacterium]
MSQVHSRDSSEDNLTVLSRQTEIRGGTLSVAHDLTVRGVIEGEVRVGGKVVVAAGAEVDGLLHAREAVVAGHVRGELVVKDTLTLRSTAVVDGTASAARLVVEEGSTGSVSLRIGDKDFFDVLERRRSEARAELDRVRSRSTSNSERHAGHDSAALRSK